MKKRRKRRRFKLIHLITLFILLYIVGTLWSQKRLMKELQTKERDNILVNEQLEMDIEELEKQIEDSQTLQFVERVAREELGMVKPREIMVIDKEKKKSPFIKKFKKDN